MGKGKDKRELGSLLFLFLSLFLSLIFAGLGLEQKGRGGYSMGEENEVFLAFFLFSLFSPLCCFFFN